MKSFPESAAESSVPEEELLVGYVEVALAQQDAGEALDLAKICAAHPKLQAAVAEALGLQVQFPAPDVVRDPLLGQLLAERYQLEKCIGMGAMGAVYRAQDLRLQRSVAVKVLQPGLFPNKEREQRFHREAQVLASLQHPHVVPVHDQGESPDGLMFLVMDLLDGLPWSSILQHAQERCRSKGWAATFLQGQWVTEELGIQISEESFLRQLARWGLQLSEGLQAAHALQILHRDVKPSNVFILPDGRAILLDFGIALREGDASLTAAGSSLGTPWYMAPEQAQSAVPVDARVDVYGLGASLYHLSCLRPPVEGEFAQVLARLPEDPPAPRSLNNWLPQDLAAIIEKATERRPQHRYADMSAMHADLLAFLQHAPVQARPVGGMERRWRKVQRRPAPALALLCLALLLVLLPLGYWLWQRQAADEYAALVATVPALLSLEGYPEKRLLQDLDERQGAIALLDRLLVLQPEDVASRLLRAALYLDHGERDRAAQDLAALQSTQPSPYMQAVASAYSQADDSRRGAAAVSLQELPEPQSAVDCFVAGFHLLRARRDYQKSLALFDAAAADYLPARDLRQLNYLVLADQSKERQQRRQYARKAYEEALFLEGVYGRPTARTRHTVGAALLLLQEYQAAVPALEMAIELRAGRHGPLQNLGIAYRRLGRLQEAKEVLLQAHALRPWLWNTIYTTAQVSCDLGDFDTALRLAMQVPDQGAMGEAWRKPYLIGRVHTERSLWQLSQGQLAASKEAAGLALSAYQESAKHGGKSGRLRVETGLVQALLAADDHAALASFLPLLATDPRNPQGIRTLAALLPDDGLGGDELALLQEYLQLLAEDLAPGDPQPKAPQHKDPQHKDPQAKDQQGK